MMKYFVVCENGFIGTARYDSYEMAADAAQFRANCTGMKWFVKSYKSYMSGV